jgi:hypothetical protein
MLCESFTHDDSEKISEGDSNIPKEDPCCNHVYEL